MGSVSEEGLKKAEHAITFTEQKLIDRGMGWQVPKFDHVLSGDLMHVVTSVCPGSVSRRQGQLIDL